MARFHFRLQSMLRWRSRQQEVAEAQLQSALAARDAILRAIDALRAERSSALAYIHTLTEFSAPELAAVSSFARHALQRLDALQPQLQEALQLVDARQAELTEARRKVKLLERLKERKLSEFQSNEDRILEETLSEIQLIRHVREARSSQPSHSAPRLASGPLGDPSCLSN